MTTTPDDASPATLAPSRWVRNRYGIARYVPPPPPAAAPDPGPYPIVCYCGARANELCATRNGNKTKAHPQRLSPKVCDCGNALAPRCTTCPECQAARKSKNDADRRARLRLNDEDAA